ncbi:hypothetical protein [Adhaeribacter pallidiroseus]|uniref:Uncharacterized protein n=1 Tax=Adhaeribacter pallidiroseus TaxID=2072847 RepID=A0A369QHZ4_9BACT|nr:hypothetical protein [Adhaeribacter pallidiroseus]RDC64344.1 hypothetical protein AHMF7616_02957 [Adhaeribacter pallidiroseus]
MDDEYFAIPVTYQGEERDFTSRLLMSGYTHKLEVEVDGHLISFEPDEDQNYRAILDESQLNNSSKIDIGLLQAIAQVIESTIK